MQKTMTKDERQELELLLSRMEKKISMKMAEYEGRLAQLER